VLGRARDIEVLACSPPRPTDPPPCSVRGGSRNFERGKGGGRQCISPVLAHLSQMHIMNQTRIVRLREKSNLLKRPKGGGMPLSPPLP